MASLLDFLSDNNPFNYTPGQGDRAALARAQSAQQLAEFKAKQDAMARLGLAPDANGIQWNPQQQPTGLSAQTMSQFQPYSEAGGAGPMQGPQTSAPMQSSPQNLLGIQHDYQNRQHSLLDIADPDTALKNRQSIAARQGNDEYVKSLNLPPDIQRAVEVGGLPGGAEASKALSTNFTVPDAIRTVNAHIATMNNSPPDSPQYKAASAMLTQITQNLPAAQLAEVMRHNRVDEANSAVTPVTDPNTGGTSFFDKRTQKIINPFPDPFSGAAPGGTPQQPPVTPPGSAPTATAPQLGTPQAAAQPQAPPARPVFNDETIQSLPPEAQAKFASLPPAMQLQLGPILSGKTAPPESGRAMTDLKLQNMMRYAALIDPNFNEQTWRQRNKMATEAVDMSASKLGGMKASAQKIINHSYDALGAAADVKNESALGTPGNWVDNTYVANAPRWMGGSPDTKASIGANAGYSTGVADEFEKLMSGGAGSEAAKTRALSLLPQNGDIATTIGGLNSISEMMRGQVEPQVRAYNEAMGTHLSVEDWLGPEATAKYKTIQNLAADLKSGKKVDAASVKSALTKPKAPINAQTIVDELRRRGAIK